MIRTGQHGAALAMHLAFAQAEIPLEPRDLNMAGATPAADRSGLQQDIALAL